MKSALFIIASSLAVLANAEGANRVVGRHQDHQDEEGLRKVAEHRGAKLRGALSNQRIPENNAYRRARILTGSMSMSAPIFEAEASISMPTRFVVPAEFSMSMPMPKSTPDKVFAKSEKPEGRKLAARRRLMESMSMSAPIFEAEASISMPTRFVVPAEFSMSMPMPKSTPDKLFAKSEKPGRRSLAAQRHLMESMSMSAPIFEAEASISMPMPKSTPDAAEEAADEDATLKLFAKSEKSGGRKL